MTNPSPEWDTQELIKRAGGPTGIRRTAAELGIKMPSSAQIYMWQNRDSIPADWVAILLVIADARGEVAAPRQVMNNVEIDPDALVEDFDPFA